MFAVMLQSTSWVFNQQMNAWVPGWTGGGGIADAMWLLFLVGLLAIGIGFTAEWIGKRPVLKRWAMASGALGALILVFWYDGWSGYSFWW